MPHSCADRLSYYEEGGCLMSDPNTHLEHEHRELKCPSYTLHIAIASSIVTE